jgi:hypothetical protein
MFGALNFVQKSSSASLVGKGPYHPFSRRTLESRNLHHGPRYVKCNFAKHLGEKNDCNQCIIQSISKATFTRRI